MLCRNQELVDLCHLHKAYRNQECNIKHKYAVQARMQFKVQ